MQTPPVTIKEVDPQGIEAHRPLDASTSEVRRMYVCPEARGMGVAERPLSHLEAHAKAHGFTRLRLETGPRQLAAMRLSEKCGFAQIPAFGPYVNDPASVCYEKDLGTA